MLSSERTRILHLATSIAGGAGIAALRIHKALVAQGMDSQFLTQGAGPSSEVHVADRSRSARALQKSSTAANRWLSSPEAILFTPLSHGVVSIADIARFEPDIVHVHNWYNFFDWGIAPVLRANGISVVTTLHDERLLTGGCHYTLDCPQAFTDCGACPQSRLPKWSRTRERRVACRQDLRASKTRLISPSLWLHSQVSALGAADYNSCEVIPNCVSPELLHEPMYASTKGRLTIGFVLGKAPGLLQATLDKLAILLGPARAASIEIIGAGGGPMPSWEGGRSVAGGRIDTDLTRAKFWDRVDVGLFVTRSDNFPNTILEGLARGTPQVVPDIGGASEAVQATSGGVVCEAEAADLAAGIFRLLEDTALREEMSTAAKNGVRELYAPSVIAEAYAHAYARQE